MAYPTSPKPVLSYGMGIQFRTVVSESEDGYEQRLGGWPKSKRTFKLSYDILTHSEYVTLRDYFNNTASGMLNSFDFYDEVSDTTYTCRFADDKLDFEQIRYRIYRGEVNLVEVF